jgi:hypothetical protein
MREEMLGDIFYNQTITTYDIITKDVFKEMSLLFTFKQENEDAEVQIYNSSCFKEAPVGFGLFKLAAYDWI